MKMKALRASRRSLICDERGLSTVEYVILLALIAAVAIATWSEFGDKVHTAVSNSDKKFETVVKASKAK